MKNSHKISQSIRGRIVATFLCFFFLAGTVAAGFALSAKAAPVKPAPKIAPQSLPLLVDVGADKCIPCIRMAPILDGLKKEYAGVLEVKFVDVWKYPDEAKKYRIMGIPTQIFYDASGKELRRNFGFISKEEILQTFEDLGIPLKKSAKK
jgi:thioredoxin 1